MSSFSSRKTSRRVLLWGLPILALILLILFTVEPQFLASEKRKGWTISLQEQERIGVAGGDKGTRSGDLAIDRAGKLWVAGGWFLGDGLHVFDGNDWDSRAGNYIDLAIDPGGKVWAVRYRGSLHTGLDVFDGQRWTSYQGRDFGLDDQQITQVEISSDGRVFITTDDSEIMRIVELISQDEDSYTAVSDHGLRVFHGEIKSLDADNQGGIWAAVWTNDDTNEKEPSGLYKLDGQTWQRVPDQGVDLRRVDRTKFDDLGNIYVITACGGVMKYDGKEWVTVVDEDASPDCSSRYGENGLFVESHDRLWLWQHDGVHLLDDGNWTSFTEDNSGYAERDTSIFGVIVDDFDRLWVASSGGVSMIPVDDVEPLREEIVNRLRLMERMNGTNWFLPAVLMLLWLAVYLNSLPGVLIAAVVGVPITYLSGAPYMKMGGYGYYVVNLFIFVTFSGMVGGLIGGQLDKDRERKKGISNNRLNIALAFIGLAVGFGLGIVYALGTSP